MIEVNVVAGTISTLLTLSLLSFIYYLAIKIDEKPRKKRHIHRHH